MRVWRLCLYCFVETKTVGARPSRRRLRRQRLHPGGAGLGGRRRLHRRRIGDHEGRARRVARGWARATEEHQAPPPVTAWTSVPA